VVLAVDVGGTKIEAGVVDGSGRVLADARVATPHTADGDEVFDALWSAVDAVRTAGSEAPLICGVGCGGPMTLHGERVSPLNIPAWRDFPLRQRLADALRVPVVVDNDAKALALGEGWLGAARGGTDYLAMVVSTGIGAGIVLDGRLLEGRTGNAGHIGHVVVEPEGRACRCGGRGCLEAEASGLAIEARTGRPPSEASEAVRRTTGALVGRAVGSVANLLDLELALVAGSVALGFGEVFFDAAQEEIGRRCGLEFSRATRIVPAGLGAAGPMIGAAALGRRWLERADVGAPP
jgi:glucokinase